MGLWATDLDRSIWGEMQDLHTGRRLKATVTQGPAGAGGRERGGEKEVSLR